MIQERIITIHDGIDIEVLADLISETVDLNIGIGDPEHTFTELTSTEARTLAAQLVIAADYIEED